MPDIIVLCGMEEAQLLQKHNYFVGRFLCDATKKTFGLYSDRDIAFMIIPFFASDNYARIQILGIASHSPELEEKTQAWRDSLAKAWVGIGDTISRLYPHENIEPFRRTIEVRTPIGMKGVFVDGQLVRESS